MFRKISKSRGEDRGVVVIVGLEYVGLPLAVEFGKKFETIVLQAAGTKWNFYRFGRAWSVATALAWIPTLLDP